MKGGIMDGENVMPEEAQEMRAPTYGERAAGVGFNPSGNAAVDTIKEKAADLIDLLNEHRNYINAGEKTPDDGEVLRLLSIAITEIQSGQMFAVKALTYKQ
jgi:hypothetical protein